MSRPQAVIFDIGNVLIHWNPEGVYDRLIGPDRRRALFAEVAIEAMNIGIDRGDPWLASVQGLADNHPEWAAEIMYWHSHWADMVAPVIDHSVRLLRALRRRGVPVFALTNFGSETFRHAQELYPFLTEFDREYVSGDMRLLKPEPEIYEAVEKGSGLPPHALLFADDKAENIAAAAARGWHTHRFITPQPWADRLVAEGLLNTGEAA